MRVVVPTHETLAGAELPPLIPAREFFADGQTSWDYRVSPNGDKLVWIAPYRGTPTIHFRALPDGDTQRVVADKPVYSARWARDSRHLIVFQDVTGAENYHVVVADTHAPGKAPVDLTPFPGVTVWRHQFLRDDPKRILVKMNRRDPQLMDLHRLDLETGDLTLLAENPGDVIDWVTDRQGRIIARMRRLPDGSWLFERPAATAGDWRTLITGHREESFDVRWRPPDEKFLWAVSNRGRDKKKVVRFDLETGEEEVVFGYPEVDVEGIWVDERNYRLLNAWGRPDYVDVAYFDEQLRADLDAFRPSEPSNTWTRSADDDLNVLVVQVEREVTGRSYFLLDRRTQTKTLLAQAPIAKHQDSLSPSKPIVYTARDGLRIHGYLTVPKGTGGESLPLVLNVHGGPWHRDRWGYRATDQFLANRGYAVMSVNYRGSTGYGRAFERASRREFARKMHDDLIDGVNWAVAQGIADPERIGIYGRSYGGYSVLVGLTFTPEVFAAGVNIVGVADLVRTAETFPPYWKQWMHRWLDYVGDPSKPEDREDMAARSPINFVDRIQRPLLMIQGANDVRVVREHSDRIAEAMEQNGKPFEYIVFDDEGHAIRKWQNRLEMARRVERFLGVHLGGRYQP